MFKISLLSSKLGWVSVNWLMPTHSTVSVFQESISDFYWYYSGKDIIDEQGQRNFSKAIQVAKQVFNTLTEYIQVSSKHFSCVKRDRDNRF